MLHCRQLNTYLTYVFTSRIWNDTMEKTMSLIKNYDTLLISSRIWDLTRFNDNSHETDFKNIDFCFSKSKLFNISVVRLLTPRVDGDKHRDLNNQLLAMHPFIISKIKEYGLISVDFSEKLKNRLKDGGR